MHWSHRVVSEQDGDERILSLCEVHYNDKGELMGYGNPSLIGEDISDLRELVAQLGRALEYPMLMAEDFPQGAGE